MHYNELIDKVEMRLRCDSAEEAERSTIATLSALSEFLSPDAARSLGTHLPKEIADKLDYSSPDEASWEEFIEIVAEKEGVNVIAEDAVDRAIKVMKIVREAYGGRDEPEDSGEESGKDALDKIQAELPEEFEPLFSGEF